MPAASMSWRCPACRCRVTPGLRFGLPAGRRLAQQWRRQRPDLVHGVTEAMASGLPVLAYCSAAVAELISDGADGSTVPPGNEKSFVGSALRLAASLDKLAAMWRQVRLAMLPCNWGSVVASFEAVVLEAVAG